MCSVLYFNLISCIYCEMTVFHIFNTMFSSQWPGNAYPNNTPVVSILLVQTLARKCIQIDCEKRDQLFYLALLSVLPIDLLDHRFILRITHQPGTGTAGPSELSTYCFLNTKTCSHGRNYALKMRTSMGNKKDREGFICGWKGLTAWKVWIVAEIRRAIFSWPRTMDVILGISGHLSTRYSIRGKVS